jgi:uncharacterized protein (DUF488 family)
MPAGPRVYTIGHSTRTAEAFLDLLREHDVRRLVDVRRFPGSRRHPQFSSGALAASLAAAGIAYAHAEVLGGRREPLPDSPNPGWRLDAFRGYADHALTPEFGRAVDDLLARAAGEPTVIMCAEAVPWRCHRRIIADHLTARGAEVVNILAPGRSEPHRLHPLATIGADGRVTYPAEQPELFAG